MGKLLSRSSFSYPFKLSHCELLDTVYFDRENQMDDMRKQLKGRPLAVDPNTASDSPTERALIARPAGAPVYHGFQVLEDVVVEGFTFGKITDFEAEPRQEGDAFVVAPDNSRAGLVWEVADNVLYLANQPA